MTPNEFLAVLVAEKLVSRDPHVVERVSELVQANFSVSAVLASQSDGQLESELGRRDEVKKEAEAKAEEQAEAKAKADEQAAADKAQAEKDAAIAKAEQDRLNAIAAAAAHAVAQVLANSSQPGPESEAK